MQHDPAKSRLNKAIASRTGMSRRAADQAITDKRVRVNGVIATPGTMILSDDTITLDGKALAPPLQVATIMLNKPRGFVVSRNGQGSKTIYDLLPTALHHLKPIGRLDKDSSGLLLLTNDGKLAEMLTHPRYAKQKIYEVSLDAALAPLHRQMITDFGIQLEDGPSKMGLERMQDNDDIHWRVLLQEGRNRQIRRTFAALGYTVTSLHRTQFGSYHLEPTLQPGAYTKV